MQKHHCCIPGCNTYTTVENFLPMPCDSYWRNQWLSRIRRTDWVMDASTLACRKHFENPDTKILTKTIADNKGKNTLTFVTTNAVPSTPPLRTDSNPCEKLLQVLPQIMIESFHRDRKKPTDCQSIYSDFIDNYNGFTSMYPKRLQTLLENPWRVIAAADGVVFYITDFTEAPRIPCSVKVDVNLCVTVTLAGKFMDPLDLTWVLPISGKLNRWSQLQIMLNVFGK